MTAQRPPAGTPAQIHARNAAAELAYPDTNHGLKTGHSFGGNTKAVVVGRKRVDMSWQDSAKAKCSGSTRWFTDKAEDIKFAKLTCLTCPLLEPCQWHALEYEYEDVWGALTAEDRRQVRRGRPVSEFLLREGDEVPEPRGPGRPRQAINHGTESGYKTHRRRGETPCAECVAANTDAGRQRAKGKAS